VLLKAVGSLGRLPLSLLQVVDYLEMLEEEEDRWEVQQPNPRLVGLEGLEHAGARQAHSQHQVNRHLGTSLEMRSQRKPRRLEEDSGDSGDSVLLRPPSLHKQEGSLRRPHNRR
jgi:hypothetical protein